MSDADLIIRGGNVVTSSGATVADIAIAGGRITALQPELGLKGADEIDASGLHVFPGGIDSHVHFNEPGRTAWETIKCGSAALAAGGYTTFVDMPLNNLPVTVDSAAFELKLEAANRSSIVDFGLWGGLVPGNLEVLSDLCERGVTGFKAFMCPSGIDEFPGCDDSTLLEGMKRIARLGSILLVHAEDPRTVEAEARKATGTGARDFVRSRPPEAELEAISRAVALAAETGCRLHVVHVSTARGAEIINEAQARGVDVSGETCPHYLLYVDDDLERLGGLGKCAPPFRTTADRNGLWTLLIDGRLAMVVSDHSPSTLDLKQGDDFFKLWGGISGCQSTRQLLLAKERLDLPTIAAVTATNVARRFELANKGDVSVGFDADLWLVDLAHEDVVRGNDLLYRNQFSAHEGQPIRGRTVRTIVRGRTVFADGQPVTAAAGRFIRAGERS
ncbi:MAG TPA: allantoinase AllB [Candidatus Dormibacteraeota bacterium]|nr:allantoinase AllB [Candidatus Dormibacteraeota bacterium]